MWNIELNKIYFGNCLDVLKTFPDESINCCVTSPPYYGLRNYKVEGQIGNENTPEQYIENLTIIFNEVWRVLKQDGVLWLNLGDSWVGNNKDCGYRPKDLIGIPWMAAFALRESGWYIRQDIIWAKPNPMPESVRDRCTKSHEYIFLMTKSPYYYYDSESIKEPVASNTTKRAMSGDLPRYGGKKYTENPEVFYRTKSGHAYDYRPTRNKRDVWFVSTKPCKEAHFATFPDTLIEPCVLAGCPEGGVVLDPFMGTGTTGMVARRNGRNYVGIELNPQYIKIAEDRINKQ